MYFLIVTCNRSLSQRIRNHCGSVNQPGGHVDGLYQPAVRHDMMPKRFHADLLLFRIEIGHAEKIKAGHATGNRNISRMVGKWIEHDVYLANQKNLKARQQMIRINNI